MKYHPSHPRPPRPDCPDGNTPTVTIDFICIFLLITAVGLIFRKLSKNTLYN